MCNAHYRKLLKYGDPLEKRHASPSPNKRCKEEGCGNPFHAKGWCASHYFRNERHRSPTGGEGFREHDPETAFLKRVKESSNSDCLEWRGLVTSSGYGVLSVKGREVRAHRYAWERAKGSVPEGMFLDHTCYNKLCVNVDHLRLATRAQNMQNRPGPQKNSTTGVRNVYNTASKRFRVVISGKHFGTYSTIEEAAQVAEQKRKELFGEFAGRG